MDDNVKAGCFIVAFGYSALSFIAAIAFAISNHVEFYKHINDDPDVGQAPDWIWVLIAPGVVAFVVFMVVGLVRLIIEALEDDRPGSH